MIGYFEDWVSYDCINTTNFSFIFQNITHLLSIPIIFEPHQTNILCWCMLQYVMKVTLADCCVTWTSFLINNWRVSPAHLFLYLKSSIDHTFETISFNVHQTNILCWWTLWYISDAILAYYCVTWTSFFIHKIDVFQLPIFSVIC